MVVAGSAGAKVRSAVRLVGEAAVRSGLWATQRGDYPVTVKSGHSVSQLVVSPEEIPPVTVETPDALVLLSDDGLRKVGAMLDAMAPDTVVLTVPAFAGVKTAARVEVIDPAAAEGRIAKVQVALVLLSAAVSRLGWFPVEALHRAAQGPFEKENLRAIEAGVLLAGPPHAGSP